MDTRISTSRDRVSNAQEFVGQLGQNVSNGPVLSAISNTIGALGPELDAARNRLAMRVTWSTG